MKTGYLGWAALCLVLSAFTASASAQVRTVPPRPGEPAGPPQAEAGDPQPLREVQPRGNNAAQAQVSQAAPAMIAPRFNPRRPRPQIWWLGIDTSDAPLGIRIRNVQRNTAADDLGLEIGDYIMDVTGYPVGHYGGVYYDLSVQLNQQADAQGWVNLNIWNYRTGQTENHWVQLDRR